MPYGKSSYYKKRNYRSRRYRRKPNVGQMVNRSIGNMTLKQAAYGAIKGVNMLKGIINSEKKRFDQNAAISVSDTPQIVNLNDIVEGDAENNRTGISILAKYMTIHYNAKMSASATDSWFRLLIFVDTQNQGTAPSAADLLAYTTAPTLSPINPESTSRFTVLADQNVTFSINGIRTWNRKLYIPLNFHIKYRGSGDYNKNSIWFMVVSSETTNTVSFDYVSRLVYYDN